MGDDMLEIAKILKIVVCIQLSTITCEDYLKYHGEVESTFAMKIKIEDKRSKSYTENVFH